MRSRLQSVVKVIQELQPLGGLLAELSDLRLQRARLRLDLPLIAKDIRHATVDVLYQKQGDVVQCSSGCFTLDLCQHSCKHLNSRYTESMTSKHTKKAYPHRIAAFPDASDAPLAFASTCLQHPSSKVWQRGEGVCGQRSRWLSKVRQRFSILVRQ